MIILGILRDTIDYQISSFSNKDLTYAFGMLHSNVEDENKLKIVTKEILHKLIYFRSIDIDYLKLAF